MQKNQMNSGDDEANIQMEADEITELELSTDKLVDVSLEINYAQDSYFKVDIHSIDLDEVAPLTL